jgi:hypothetical protein
MNILVWLFWFALVGSLFVLGKYLKAHRPDLFDDEGRFRVKIEPAAIPFLFGLFFLWGFGYETLSWRTSVCYGIRFAWLRRCRKHLHSRPDRCVLASKYGCWNLSQETAMANGLRKKWSARR